MPEVFFGGGAEKKFGEGAGVGLLEEEAVCFVADALGRAAAVGGDYGFAEHPGFGDDEAENFPPGGGDDAPVYPRHAGGEIIDVVAAVELHDFLLRWQGIFLCHEGFYFLADRGRSPFDVFAVDVDGKVGEVLGAEQRNGAEEDVDAFVVQYLAEEAEAVFFAETGGLEGAVAALAVGDVV